MCLLTTLVPKKEERIKHAMFFVDNIIVIETDHTRMNLILPHHFQSIPAVSEEADNGTI